VLARSSDRNGRQARYRFLFENETALVALRQDRNGLIEQLGISLE
jgi:D-alanyl-D-alanine carboxypeptidase